MLTTIFSYKKDSYEFSKKELEILRMFLEYFKYEIPNGNGSYLSMLDLDKIDFIWSPEMLLNDQGVFGLWILTFPNNVFLRPSECSSEFIDKVSAMDLSGKRKEIVEKICCSGKCSMNQFPNLNVDQELLKFTIYLCECEGVMLSTILHELYHKWQFNVSKLLYIINFFVFLFTGYEFSTKSKFSIEGDVRIYVDNEELHKRISEFYRTLYYYFYIKNALAATDVDEEKVNDLVAQMKDLYEKNPSDYEFIKKIEQKIAK